MFVELVYDKHNVAGLVGAGEITLSELTKRRQATLNLRAAFV